MTNSHGYRKPRTAEPRAVRRTGAVGVLLLVMAVALLIAYALTGSHVDADGRLHEPFALIPMAWLAGLSGVVLVTVSVWRRRRVATLAD